MRLFTNKNIQLIALLLFTYKVSYSQSNTSTTLTINSNTQPQAVADYIARDKIIVLPNNRLVAGNPTGQTHLYLDKNIIAAIDVNGYPYSEYDVGDSYTIDKSLPVGFIDGSYSVNNGQSSYNIPIPLAPGTNGMTPNISIQYNSSQTDGLVGVGWNISGISSITRVPRNYFHRGNNDEATSVVFTSADLFSLDGNNLGSVISAGSSVRRLEHDNFTEVDYVNPTGTNDFFKVTTKDGLYMEYGSDPDSKLMVNVPTSNASIALRYYLKKVIDKNGNYYTYHYYNQNGEVAIQEIKYTGTTTFSPYNSVKFYYDTRDDKNLAYFKGNTLNSTLILREIELFCENSSFKKIIPKYQYLNDKSYLSEITEYSANNTKVNPTKFAYESVPSIPNTALNLWPLDIASVSNLPALADYSIGDYNGDGKSDIMAYTYTNIDFTSGVKTYTGWQLYLNQNDGKNYYNAASSQPGDPYIAYSNYGRVNEFNTEVVGNFTTDLDGDGKEDIILIEQIIGQTTYYKPYFSNFTGNTGSFVAGISFSLPSESQIKIADIDGDKRPEIVAYGKITQTQGNLYIHNINSGGTTISASDPANDPNIGGPSTNFKIVQAVDFDEDGTKELLIEMDGGKTRAIKIRNYGTSQNLQFSEFGQDPTVTSSFGAFYYGDFNGDGITDRLIQSASNATLRYGTGKQNSNPNTYYTSTKSITLPASHSDRVASRVLIADMDNDGKSDIVTLYSITDGVSMYITYGRNISTNVYIGKYDDSNYPSPFPMGIDFTQPPPTFQTDGHKVQEFCLGDFDGNGYLDIMFKRITGSAYNGERSIIYNQYFKHPLNTCGKLSRVTNGFGRDVKFKYKPISDPTVYTIGTTGGSYPIVNLFTPISVVSQVNAQDANGNFYNVDYQYEDAKLHVTGGGFLGFGKISVTNNLMQSKVVTEFDLFNQSSKIPCRSPISYKTYLLSNLSQPINEKNITYYPPVQSFNYPITFNYYIIPHIITEIDNYYGTSTIKTLTFDNFMNLTEELTNINSGYQINKVINEIDANLHGNKYPSYVKSVTTEQTRQGEAMISRYVQYAFYPNGLLANTTNFFGKPCENYTNFQYNTAGMLLNSVENSAGNQPRTTDFQYDNRSRFVIQKTNSIGYIEKYTFDNRFGRPIQEIDINNLATNYTYDGFGRNTSVTTPDNNTVYFNQKWYDVSDETGGDPYPTSNSLIVVETVPSNKPIEKTFFTASGLATKSTKQGFNQTYVSNLIEYNNKGLEENSRASYLIPCPNSPCNVLLTTRLYDSFDRIYYNRTTDGIDDLITTTNYLPNSNGFNTAVVTSPDGKTKSTTIDPVGLMTSVTDNLNSNLTYGYYSDGKSKDIQLNGNLVLSNTYDIDCGYLQTQNEPNYGISYYTRDGFGQLKSSTNDGKTFSYTYDLLGRLFTKAEPGGVTYNYFYKSTNGGKGRIEIESASTGAMKKHYYDNLARATKVEEITNGLTFATQMEYDQYSNPVKYTYPSGFAVRTIYDNLGFPTQIKNDATGSLLWQADEINSFGQYTKFTLGNGGMQTTKTYDNFGFLTNESTSNMNIFDHSYEFDKYNGNLNFLNDNVKGLNETFEYTDNLNRLNVSTVKDLATMQPLTTPLTLVYEPNGNIYSKSDIGLYKYQTTPLKPNAVEYVQDNNNLNSHINVQDIAYNAFEQPYNILDGNVSADIYYGVDQERIKATYVDPNNSQNFTRYYLNNFDKEINGTDTREIHYLQAPGGLIGIHVIENGVSTTYFVYSDHLGTPKTITDSQGNVVYEQNFDAWGRRRNPNTWDYSNITPPPAWLIRGFTGHEDLPQFNLINMNGRMYDPLNARMLSPDPALQDATNSQNHNKYSYALNNPLKYTDATGKYITYMAAGLFQTGDVLDHLLNRYPGGEYENERLYDGIYNGSMHGWYAYEQVMSMTQYEVAKGKEGDFSYSLSVGLSMGTGGLGIGANGQATYRVRFQDDWGTEPYLDLSVGLSTAFNNTGGASPGLFKNTTSAAAGFEFGNNEFHAGLYTTKYFSGETSQRVGGMNIGGKYWGLNYENDGAFPFDKLRLGDGGDNDRTAALRFRYKDFSAGFNLATEKRHERPDSDNDGNVERETTDGWKNADKKLNNKYIYKTEPSGRFGGIYVGYGNHYIGINSDFNRQTIQNDIIHNAVGSPHFINYDYGSNIYGGYWPTKKFSLW